MWIAETIDLDDHDSVVRFMKKQSDKIKELEKENEELKKVAEEFTQKPTQHNLWKLRTVLKELKGDVE